MFLFHLLATIIETHLTQTKRQQQDSENSIFCTQRLAITGTSAPALADQKLSTSFSTVAEAFLLSWSAFCLLHPPPPFMLTVLAFYFHLLLSICNSWFAVLFPTLLLCFCLRSSFCKSPALRSVGSKDTCGGCVHSRTFVRFIKGKPAEWNCSFLNNCRDRETGRQKGDEGRGSWWQEKILTFSVHLWYSESVIDGRFEGRFQKSKMFRGLNGIHKILSEKATKGWEQEKNGIILQCLSNWYFPGTHKVLIVNGLLLSDNKTKPPLPSSVAPTQPNC